MNDVLNMNIGAYLCVTHIFFGADSDFFRGLWVALGDAWCY